MKAMPVHPNNKVIPYRKLRRRAFPNAAGKQYYLNKFLDYALAAATSLGAIVILLVLMTMA